jgi:hypothetical protein
MPWPWSRAAKASLVAALGFDLRLVLGVLTFQEVQPGRNGLAGIAEAAGGDGGFDEAVAVNRQGQIAGRQGEGLVPRDNP